MTFRLPLSQPTQRPDIGPGLGHLVTYLDPPDFWSPKTFWLVLVTKSFSFWSPKTKASIPAPSSLLCWWICGDTLAECQMQHIAQILSKFDNFHGGERTSRVLYQTSFNW